MIQFPKPLPAILFQRKRKAAVVTKDRAENAFVRRRSGGRCEVIVDGVRCERAAVGEPHHLIGGSGRRNIGDSILAKCKLAVCRACHEAITRHVLIPTTNYQRSQMARTVRYTLRTLARRRVSA